MPFGQVVIGPPGAGKTTYCEGMRQFLTGIGRKVAVINLDPANENLPYQADVDIMELVSLEEAAEEMKLGPNGGLVWCVEYLEANFDWLEEKLAALPGYYLLFDCPGQVELYTHHNSVRNILHRLQKLEHRLVTVHLVDAFHCSEPTKFISVLLVTLSTMMQLEMPHINVLSKIDLVEQYGPLAFNLDFYTDVMDPERLLPFMQAGEDAWSQKHLKLNKALCELVEDFGLVAFETLNITDKESVWRVLKVVDKANGYVFAPDDKGAHASVFAAAAGPMDWEYERVGAVQEKYMPRSMGTGLPQQRPQDQSDELRDLLAAVAEEGDTMPGRPAPEGPDG